MTTLITLSIDETLIDKSRLKEVTRRNGKVAKFLNLVLIDTPNSEYGDFIVKQSVSKEEKAAGVQLPILGNGKRIEIRPAPSATAPASKENHADPADSDDVPF